MYDDIIRKASMVKGRLTVRSKQTVEIRVAAEQMNEEPLVKGVFCSQ